MPSSDPSLADPVWTTLQLLGLTKMGLGTLLGVGLVGPRFKRSLLPKGRRGCRRAGPRTFMAQFRDTSGRNAGEMLDVALTGLSRTPRTVACTLAPGRLSSPGEPRETDMDQQLPTDPHAEIRAEVAKLCGRFPGEYWRKLDQWREYPTEFVHALTEAGYLAALIPEEYGGAGLPLSAAAAILETIHAEGCNGAACHAQMYIMGTILRHGSPAQKQEDMPKIATGELRLQAFGVTEPSSGTDTTNL